MKKMRRLIPAFAMLLVAATMLSTASFAWFTMGTYAEVSGMEVQADATSSLLIVNKYDTTGELEKFQNATNTVDLTSYNASESLYPATYSEDFDSTLATVGDTTKVNPTGKYDAEEYGALEEVLESETNTSKYYIDYTVYLFAAGTAVTGKKLQVTVTPDAFTDSIHNAVTINFLVAETKGATPAFVEKINFETAKVAANSKVNLGAITIPVGLEGDTVGEYVTVIMRVYYDGELPDASATGKNYVRNERIVPDGTVGFSVRFDLVD